MSEQAKTNLYFISTKEDMFVFLKLMILQHLFELQIILNFFLESITFVNQPVEMLIYIYVC